MPNERRARASACVIAPIDSPTLWKIFARRNRSATQLFGAIAAAVCS